MDGVNIDLNVIQNLEDAGCDASTIETFIRLLQNGETKKQLLLLSRHRANLLHNLHENQRQIDCLDYLAYQIKKEAGADEGGNQL